MFSTHTQQNIIKFLLVFLLLMFNNNNSQAQCISISQSDSLALVAFYAATNGDTWLDNSGWLSAPVSDWNGITLTSNGCSVKAISLPYQQMQGFLPDLNLPNLEELTLFNNNLVGEIPNFSNLPQLKRLFLGNVTVSVFGNEFTGNIPDFDNLPNLEELHLGQNRLTGEVPDFSFLPNLKRLDLGNSANFQMSAFAMESNELSGGIPDFSNLPQLENLSLSGNDLTGEIPDFSNMPRLKSLNLGENQLTGNIPNFSNIDSLYNLQLVENQLNGTIPNFNSFIYLEELNLAHNILTGQLPSFDNLATLKHLKINNNLLNSELPSFSNLQNLEMLNLEFNRLLGNIPDFNLPNLTSLLLGQNRLFGTIPNFSNLPNLNYFSAEENLLNGEIPNFNQIPNLRCLILSGNNLDGEIPNFNNLSELDNLYLYDNDLNGNIPNFNNLQKLTNLFLHENDLNGSIPNLDSLPELKNLYLYNNQLTGFIPVFDNLLNLEALYVHNNQLIGNIPNFDLPNLAHLQVCPNALTGSIPSFNNCPDLVPSIIDFACIAAAQTTGIVYADLNGNCIKEADEPLIPNAIIATTDSTAYAFSDENGFYTLKMEVGTHTFSCMLPNYLWQQYCLNSPETYTVNMIASTDSLGGFDFAFQPLISCPLMLVEVGTPLLRRCFTNVFTINYCNTGTLAAENASIKLLLDEAIIPLESSVPYILNAENELVFNIGTVGIGECSSFTLTDSLSCDAVLGSTACVEAFALPNDLCLVNNSFWDGSDLEINASCLGNEVVFEIVNRGEDMEAESEYRMYEDDVLSIVSVFQLMAGETLEVSRSTTGQAFRLTAYQNNHPMSEFITAVIELCGVTAENMASLGFVNTQSNLNYTQFYDMECQEIIGSYDPNDKTATPKGVGEEHRITDFQELEYKIRFQNVGSDTAFRVIVIDTIDTDFLNMNTLQLGVSSHDYTAEIIDNNLLVFTFENIFLIDSNANEAASHGFLMFKISQKETNQTNDLIQNEAAIYFDYNQPVITNKAFNIIGLPKQMKEIVGITAVEETFNAKVFYDNVYLNILLPLSAAQEQYSFTLYDILGRDIKHETRLSLPKHDLLVGHLTAGVYVFEIEAASGEKASSKLIVP